jgi:hypothetical protein
MDDFQKEVHRKPTASAIRVKTWIKDDLAKGDNLQNISGRRANLQVNPVKKTIAVFSVLAV